MSSVIQMSLSIPTPSRNLSSIRVLTTCPDQTHFLTKFPQLSLHTISLTPITTTIRMGGGPRTFPGGVSKWEWKRMQAKKAKQLLKARLCRERQIYEMRKRAELRAAVSELEKPWEVVERAPALFSVKADEQLKVLADRFQRPGGYDLWSENDGPQLFHTAGDLPSARFFPKGVVHSIKPYESLRSADDLDSLQEFKEFTLGDSNAKRSNGSWRSRKFSNRRGRRESDSGGEDGVVLSIESYGSVRSRGGSGNSEDFNEFNRGNGSGRLGRFFNNRIGRGESDGEREDGCSNLTSMKDNQDGKRSYSKRLAFLGESEERGKDMEGFRSVEGRHNSREYSGGGGRRGMEGFSSVEGRHNSRDYNGGRGGKGKEGFSSVEGRDNSREYSGGRGGKGVEGFSSVEGRHNPRDYNGSRGGKGSSRGSSRRTGSRGNLGSGISDGSNSEKEGRRNEIPFRGRGGCSSNSNRTYRQYNTGKGSSIPSRTGEIYDLSLKSDRTYEF